MGNAHIKVSLIALALILWITYYLVFVSEILIGLAVLPLGLIGLGIWLFFYADDYRTKQFLKENPKLEESLKKMDAVSQKTLDELDKID